MYFLFFCRDVLTIAGGFTLPPLLSAALQKKANLEAKYADKITQLTTPMAMQLVCTPLHLAALNMYNEQGVTLAQRASSIWKTLPQTTFTRMFRQLAAYGIGGVGNRSLIAKGRKWAENKYQ